MADSTADALLTRPQLQALRNVAVEKRFLPGDRLISIGARSREVFYLLEGRVRVVVVAESGLESVFGVRTPGSFIGEMSTLNDDRRSADVVAVTPTIALMVSAANFTRFLEAHPEVALALLRMLSRRLNEMTARTMLGAKSVKARVAQRLLELSSKLAADSAAGNGPLEVAITQADLAKWIDASREWTSKALGDLQRDGAIRTGRGRIFVLDPDSLQAASFEP